MLRAPGDRCRQVEDHRVAGPRLSRPQSDGSPVRAVEKGPVELGRWGKDDEIGAMNLIGPAKWKQAAALVKEGLFAT
jgi:hypothetical protein